MSWYDWVIPAYGASKWAVEQIPGASDAIKKVTNKVKGLTDESDSATQQRENLNKQAGQAGSFADELQRGYSGITGEGQDARGFLRDQAMGKNSLSAEQLRQGLQQQQAQMQSTAAGAPATSAPMAARTAMLGMGRAASGMAGQSAMAGVAERAAAQKAWADAIAQQRQQDLQGALQARQSAISGYQDITPDKSTMEKWAAPLTGAASVATKLSDRRAKTDVDDASGDVDAFLDTVAPWSFRYLDEAKHGAGRQIGIMAQELQASDAGRDLVLETEEGLKVDLQRAIPLLLATVARLNQRVRELEARG